MTDHADTPGLGPEWPEALEDYCPLREFAVGDVVRKEGVHYTSLFLIRDGEMDVHMSDRHRAESIVRVTKGEPVGEFGFLAGQPANATVTAATSASAFEIDSGIITRIEAERPKLAAELLRYLAHKMEERDKENATFRFGDLSHDIDRPLNVVLCRNDSMLLEAKQLRYRVYCEELGRTSPYADHEAGTLSDDLDAFGHTFVAYNGEKLVGTIRVNMSSEGSLGATEEIYNMNASPDHPDKSGIVTKLIVSREHRGDLTAFQLIAFAVKFGVHQNKTVCFIDCNLAMLPYYRAMGFRHAGPKFVHKEGGVAVPLSIDLIKHYDRLTRDISRLDLVGFFLRSKYYKLYYRTFGKSALQ